MNESNRLGGHSGSRPTIGLLINSVVDSRDLGVWSGIADVAQERDVNLVSFPTGEIGGMGSVLYDLAGADNVDGLIFSLHMDRRDFESLYERYRPLPTVNVLRTYEGYHGVVVDNYHGMQEAIRHLIDVHRHRRVAFIRGRKETLAAQERYRAYIDVLAEYGLPLDPHLVAPGDFSQRSGGEAVRLLLDERKARFEAIVASNDWMALGALEALQARGVRVPNDVALVGVDDIEDARTANPPLTTLRQPWYEWGRRAAEMLLSLLMGDQVPERVILSPALIARRSCGCFSRPTLRAATQGIEPDDVEMESALVVRRGLIVAEMAHAAQASLTDHDPRWGERLLDAFSAEMGGEPKGAFLSALEDILRQVVTQEAYDVTRWHEVLSVLRRHALPCLVCDSEALARAEGLWGQGRVLVGEAMERARLYQGMRERQQAGVMREIGQALTTTFDVAQLADVIAEGLPRLGIKGCYLSLYGENGGHSREWSRLILAFDERGRVALGADGQCFSSAKLAPDGTLPQGRRYSIVVEPLYFRSAHLGFAMFESGPQEGRVYDVLRGQLSSALQGALLVQEGRQSEKALARERDLLQMLLDGSPDYICLKDRELRFIRTNRAHAQQVLGLADAQDAIGKTDFDLFLREDAQKLYDQEQRIMRSGQPVVAREWQVPGHTGETVWVSEHKIPMRNDAGQVIGLVSIARDITARKQAEADVERRALQLRTAAEVARVASSVLDPDMLMRRVVNLVRDRLDLYYAGLFLVDENGEWTGDPGCWAVLRAGTGQAGRQMIAQGHKLEVGGASMVGSCIALGTGRIALDVTLASSLEPGQQAVRFENPLLPHTRSELALPLTSRGKTIGAMTIQSTEQAAFSEADITALQVMADQLANAIQNARLYAEAQESVQRVRTLYETSRVLSSTLEEGPLVRAILKGISQRMGCEYAIVFVVDEQTHTIEGRHGLWQGKYDVFPEWIELSRYPLDHPDILSEIYRTGRTEIIAGWDDRFNREIYEKFGHERLLRIFMPVEIRERVIGVIEVGYDRREKGHISDDEVQLLGAFVDQAAVALENARLFEQARARAEELATLNGLSRTLSARLSVEEVLDAVCQGASHLLDVSNFYVALYDSDRDEVRFAYDVNAKEGDQFDTLPADRGLTGYIIRHRTSVLIREDVPKRLAEMGIEMVGAPALSWLGVPMMVGDRVLGVMAIQSYTTPRAYDEHDRELLTALASQTAVALQNAQLLQETQRALRETEALNAVGSAVSRSLQLEETLQEALTQALAITGFDVGLVSVADPATGRLSLRAHRDLPEVLRRRLIQVGLEGTLCDHVYQQGEAVAIEDLARGAPVKVDGLLRWGLRSYLGVPLESRGKVVGTICVFGYDSLVVQPSLLSLMQAVGQQVGVAIENAWLFEDAGRRANSERVLRDISDKMQRAADMQSLMRIAAEELNRALGASRAYVRMGAKAELSTAIESKG